MKRGGLYFDRAGSPIDDATFARLHSDKSYQRLIQENVGFFWVSTIWTGINHGFGRHLAIFETLVVTRVELELSDISGNGFGGEYSVRYGTERKAFVGHRKIVAALERGTRIQDLDAVFL